MKRLTILSKAGKTMPTDGAVLLFSPFSESQENVKCAGAFLTKADKRRMDPETKKVFDLIGDTKTRNGTLRARLTVNGLSLWDAVSSDLFIDNSLFPTLKEICEAITIIGRAIEAEKPKVVEAPEGGLPSLVAREICAAKNIGFRGQVPGASLRKYAVHGFRRARFSGRSTSRKKAPPGKIIVVSFDRNNAKVTLPIARRRKDFHIITHNGRVDKFWRQNNVAFTPLEAYFCTGERHRADSEHRKLMRLWRELSRSPPDIRYREIGLWPLLRERMGHIFRARLLELLYYQAAYQSLFSESSPRAVIIHNEIVAEGIIPVSVSRQQGVPSIGVQHAVQIYSPVYDYGRGLLPDYMAVLGQAPKSNLVSKGTPAKNITVTGQPRYDQIPKMKFNQDSIRSKFKIDKSKKTILLASQPVEGDVTREARESTIRQVVRYARNHDCQLIIKLHPRETPEDHRRILREEGSHARVLASGDIHELINVSSVLVTFYSTTAIESMIFKTPVLCVNLGTCADAVPFVEYGAALGAYTEKDISRQLAKILGGGANLSGKMRSFVLDYAYKIDGNASKRVEGLIDRVTGIHK